MASKPRLAAGTRYYYFKTRKEPSIIREIDKRSKTGERNAKEKYSNCSLTKDGERVWTF